jgi:hypothetical protein
MGTPRSKYSKVLRKFEFERLICSTILEKGAFPGSAELAEKLGVTPRTIRNYFKERRLELCGSEKIWLQSVDEQGRKIENPEVLTLDECARKMNQSVQDLRRQIWMERRDRIAALRAAHLSRNSSQMDA